MFWNLNSFNFSGNAIFLHLKRNICTCSAFNVRIYLKRSKRVLYNKLCRACYRLIYSGICTCPNRYY
nr:MAG TPA: hypothetical protein [Caudoviricetes sp.]